MGKMRPVKLKLEEQFVYVNDERLRMTLIGMSDRYNQEAREIIYRTYQDDQIASIYRAIRASGVYQRGGKVRRKILEFPNPTVYDFVETAMTALYGPEWPKNRQALRHELVRPWLVIDVK